MLAAKTRFICNLTRPINSLAQRIIREQGEDNIAGFSIDQTTRQLTVIKQTPTEKTPRSFAIDASGRFLYAAGQSSGRIAAYRIKEDGRLATIESYDSGPISWAVVTVDTAQQSNN